VNTVHGPLDTPQVTLEMSAAGQSIPLHWQPNSWKPTQSRQKN